ncbi:MAG: S9 family peptidase [Methanobacteriota archaeon]|nr:MAG: S9 family peptidase [Euryarchaeota archaeon]
MESQKLAPIRDKGNFDLETLASMPSFYFPTLSHKKDKLAFYWDRTGRNELYIMDLATKEIRQISNGEVPKTLRAGFIWSRDDTKILFAKDKDGDEQHNIHMIDITTKEVEMLTNTPEFQEYIVDSSPDGKWYSLVSNRNGQMNVFRISTDGETIEQITAHENPAFGGKFSPNGEYLVYSTNEENDLRNSDIYLAKTDGTHTERIIQIKVGSNDSFADWSKDGRYIAFTTDASGISQPGIYDMETKEIRFLGDGKHEQYAGKFSDNGKFLVGMQNIEGSVTPVIFDLETGEQKQLDFPKGIAAGTQLKDDRYLFLTINTPTMPSQLIKFDLQAQESEVLLNTDTKGIDPSLFVDGEHIWYPSLDGTMIPAIIYKPRDFDPSYKYPAIVLPHGGPTAQYFLNFSMMAQYLADLGYVVLLPNVRGSTGYGVEFRDACLKDWGGKDHDDWVAGRQYIIDNYSVDPKRVAVFGGSYGGYATLVCLTKSPDLWAAGCAWVPVSHLKNMYEKSMPHFKYFLRMQMGDPVKDADLWEERSPLNYVENIKAPLLLVHGTNDPRCPVTESRNVRNRLLELGRKEGPDGDFEFVEYTDEGHGAMSDIQGRIRSMKLFTDFLKRRLSN